MRHRHERHKPLAGSVNGCQLNSETEKSALTSLAETFENPNGTDNTYKAVVQAGNSLDPSFTSPDLPTSWGTKSALVTIGPDYGSAFWLNQGGAESPTGYYFSASFIVETNGELNGNGITLFISKPEDWTGPLAAWRLYMYQGNGELELALVLGLDTIANNSSGAVYKMP